MLKIISGGQTGVDRGALDAAVELGAEYGGWCPAGRLAEDGTIPQTYRLKEMPTDEYAARTARNVAEADGTLIICKAEPSGGTRATVEFCRQFGKAFLLIDCKQLALGEAIDRAAEFVSALSCRAAGTATNLTTIREQSERLRGPSHTLGMTVLNVAGPRASQWPEGHEIARQIVSAVLRRVSGHKGTAEYSA